MAVQRFFRATTARSPWPWLSRGLRWLAMLAAAVVLMLSWQSNYVRHERSVIAEVSKFDARIHYDYELRGAARPPGPQWLRSFLGDDFFATVAGIEIKTELVTAETVAAIATLPHLQQLLLNAEGVDDAGLLQLAAASELEQLTFRSAVVTDAGLTQLAALKHLTSLTIAAPHITDVGLISLEELPNLTLVELISTDVTADGVARLRAALPKCDVRVYPAPSSG
ncbi:MAG: hypothetical protein AB7O59_21240 [Pirellulales bacterium]